MKTIPLTLNKFALVDERDYNSSIYLGVCYDKSRNKWLAHITVNRKRKHLGRFETEVEATKAYNRVALVLRGEFASINKIIGAE